ncbi:MAG: MFS transporter [Rhodocyclaceae bacterium]|nr:MFS transporter [Rhodocyclaceae bacterium]MCA3038968.1 MFS transporter [Rhodocyclaceae bacterium]MCA3045508.1 MFS transporter [Rhodocyclaceae bacterium]MCA3050214.1 MFS transporter [Rhodocyclaceae bacterium]MCA3066625.1 MFS transporter [Rhodocyclaceae bacterium]
MPASIYVIGLVSMLNDIATEMVTPIIPILLATTLASGPIVLGLVEGLANAVACVVQIYAGRLSDARGGRRKPLAVTGYLVSNVVRPLLGFATAWWHVVLIRSLDRVGKGIRNAPRDALIVDLSPLVMRARAFGIHRAFDNLGAVGGAILGALLITAFSSNLKDVLMISAIPGLLCVALFAFGVREKRKAVEQKPMVYALHWRDVPPSARGYLIAVMMFTFARTAELFIVLRAHELGASTVHALMLWAALNFIKIFGNYAAGAFADRYGRTALLRVGWVLNSVAMLGFVLVSSLASLWIAALFFGFAMSINEGVERAVIGDLADERARGALFGWYYALVGIVSIPAGLLLGTFWQVWGSHAAYGFAAAAGFVATGFLVMQVPKRV